MDWFGVLAIQKTLNSLVLSLLYGPVLTSIHDYWKTIILYGTFVGKVMSLLFNMLSRFVIVFLPRSKHLLISWLQSSSVVILEPKKSKYVTASTVSLSICHEMRGLDAMILVFECWASSQPFRSSLTLSSRGSLVLHFLPVKWYHLHIWGCWYFSQKFWLQLVIHPAWHFTWCTLHIL